MDRVVVAEAGILIVDHKTNAIRPERPEDTPPGLLRQLGAYRAAARAVWPGRPVATAILWTRDRALMRLPDALVDAAWQDWSDGAPAG
jgi:ATP-dependent helicase/nuclease subunit A